MTQSDGSDNVDTVVKLLGTMKLEDKYYKYNPRSGTVNYFFSFVDENGDNIIEAVVIG